MQRLGEEDVEEDDGLLEYICESCVFLEMRRNEWQSQGHGVARLLRHSEDLVIFQFRQDEQLIIADVVRRVGAPRLVLRSVRGGGERVWVWPVPDFADGPSHAVRFASQELGRRFHDEWAATGCGMFKTGFTGCAAPRAVSVSLIRRPVMLGIMAGMDQKDSCPRCTGFGFSGR